MTDIQNLTIEVNKLNEKQETFFKDLIFSKVRLPEIKMIKLDQVSNSDLDYNAFFENWFPPKLQLFCLNCPRYDATAIKAEFYINSLWKAVSSVTKEVFIDCFEFSEAELEQIIKSTSNAERVVLNYWDIRCSTVLDFGSEIKHKIKHLSFEQWGYSDKKTDWISNPSCYENIINAISKCELKSSLQEINIFFNSTLNIGKVKELFVAKGMSNITFLDSLTGPLAI